MGKSEYSKYLHIRAVQGEVGLWPVHGPKEEMREEAAVAALEAVSTQGQSAGSIDGRLQVERTGSLFKGR